MLEDFKTADIRQLQVEYQTIKIFRAQGGQCLLARRHLPDFQIGPFQQSRDRLTFGWVILGQEQLPTASRREITKAFEGPAQNRLVHWLDQVAKSAVR